MKVINIYKGVVKKLAAPPELSLVSLTEESTGKTIDETTAVTENLLTQNLTEGDNFKVTIYQTMDGKLIGDIEKYNPI